MTRTARASGRSGPARRRGIPAGHTSGHRPHSGPPPSTPPGRPHPPRRPPPRGRPPPPPPRPPPARPASSRAAPAPPSPAASAAATPARRAAQDDTAPAHAAQRSGPGYPLELAVAGLLAAGVLAALE